MEYNIDYLFNEIAAKTIKKYREKLGLSLEEVAKRMKTPISRQSLYKYENNLARMKNTIFIDICNALKIDPAEVFQEINEKLLHSAGKLSKEINMPVDFQIFDSNGVSTTVKAFGTKEMQEKFIEENNNRKKDELDILFDKNKDILTESDKNIMKAIITERRKQIDKELGESDR